MSPASDRARQRSVARTAGIPRRIAHDPQMARQYQELKRQLGRSAVGLSGYTAGNGSFADRALANAGIELPLSQGSSSHGSSTLSVRIDYQRRNGGPAPDGGSCFTRLRECWLARMLPRPRCEPLDAGG